MTNFLFGGGSVKPIEYTGIQIQTSALDMPIPFGYGQNRISHNLIWYNNFQRHDASSFFGKGGGKGDNYTYTAAVILALGEGIISSIIQVFYNQNTLTTLGDMGLSLFTGTSTQTPWGYVVANYPSQALSYADTAYVANDNMNLGSAASVPAISFEAVMAFQGTSGVTDVPDVNPALFIPDFLTNPRYGMGLSSGDIDAGSLEFFENYCQSQGIFMSPFLYNAEKATTVIDRWAQLANTWIFVSGGIVKFVPLGDAPLSANGATYTPATNVIYDIGPEVFLGKDPIKVSRIDPADAFNRIRVTISDRTQQYNSNPIFFLAANLVNKYGLRDGKDVDAKEICIASIGQICANLIGQREAYLRNTYSFTLPHRYLLLEPGDIIKITHPFIESINHLPVRVKTIEENDKGELSVEAEEWPGNVGIYYPHNQQTGQYETFNQLQDPGNVN